MDKDSGSENDAFDDVTSIEDGDSNVSTPEATSNTKLPTVKRSLKSIYRLKQNLKVGQAEKVVDTHVSNPQVKNTVKDIINLLKGLDSISGENPDDDDDDPYLDDKTVNPQGQTSTKGNATTSTIPSRSTVRISNIIVKYDDPHYAKCTFETFDYDDTRRKDDEKQADSKHSPRISSRRKQNNKSNRGESARPNYKSTVSFDQNDNENHVGNNGSHDNSPSRTTTNENQNLNRHSNKSNVKLAKDNSKRVKQGETLENGAFVVRQKPSKYTNKELAEIMKLCRKNPGSEDGDDDNASRNQQNNDEDKFFSYSHNKVYKEPSLNFYLPSSPDLWTSSKNDSVQPENFGAPYFRLDGALKDDVKLPPPLPRIDISKYVNTAVQEQKALYNETTEHERALKKRIKNDSSQTSGKSKTHKR